MKINQTVFNTVAIEPSDMCLSLQDLLEPVSRDNPLLEPGKEFGITGIWTVN